MCVGAILAVADGFPEDLAIIGDVFLKSCTLSFTPAIRLSGAGSSAVILYGIYADHEGYTIFDQSNDARIGLAASVNNL